jgi:hypothetical protein
MKTKFLKAAILCVAISLSNSGFAQNFNQLKSIIQYWVGSGTDSSALVVTFNSSRFDSSFVWGVLHNDTISASDMLDSVAKFDNNFAWVADGAFLDSINYAGQFGKNSSNGFFWGLFNYKDTAWASNSGLNEKYGNQGVLGLSYTDFNPTVRPGSPIPALNPHEVSLADWPAFHYFGEGNSEAILVVDFAPNAMGKSFAFKVKFNDSTTGLGLLQQIAAEDSNFRFVGDAFLSDVYFETDSGIGGSPNYWGTWSASNFGNWRMNNGLSEKVFNGDLFSCTYTSFAPAERPTKPAIISGPDKNPASIKSLESSIKISAYPNPFSNNISITYDGKAKIQIMDMKGKKVHEFEIQNQTTISTHEWSSGVYMLIVSAGNHRSFIKIIKE